MDFAIFTDTSANLPTPLLEQMGVEALPFTYYIDGKKVHEGIASLEIVKNVFDQALAED